MCIFCDIANKKIPSKIVYEDSYTLAFLDLSPVNPGHTLIIPKKHFENVLDLDEEYAEHLGKAIVKVTNLLKTKLNVENLNVINNSGKLSGQTVMHLHFHLIPRKENDNLVINFNESNAKEEDLIRVYEQLTN